MTALLSFIALILIVVSVHEFGHYWVARRCGVRVLRFSVGFGKPLWRRKDANQTEWVLAPIPLGGYVRLLDEQTARESGMPFNETMEAQSNWRRILIYVAGPAANFILAAAVMVLLLSNGEVGFLPKVGDIRANSVAANAGVRPGDVFTTIKGDGDATMWKRLELTLLDAAIGGDEVVLETERGSTHPIDAGAVAVDDMQRGIANAFGMIKYDGYLSPTIALVADASPAAAAGLQRGDMLVAVDGALTERWHEVLTAIHPKPGQAVALIVWRNNTAITTTAVLEERKDGIGVRGYLGVAPTVDQIALQNELVTVQFSPPQLLAAAFSRAADDINRTFTFISLMLRGGASADNISGPVGIASQSGEAADRGVLAWLRFMALISTSLAALNLLPLPLLDGGQITVAMVQLIIRRDLPKKFLRIYEAIGAALILMLTIWVVVKDSLLLWG